jgi:aspartate/methionine/tyrosine aminotransferase
MAQLYSRQDAPNLWDGTLNMARLAATVATTPHSGIRVMAELARAVPDALNLGVGDPNFDTPDHILEAAARAAREGFTKYTPSGGFVSLRELIAEKVRRVNGLECSVDQVVVTTGGCGGLFTTLLCLVEPGDEVLLPDPGWANYPPMVHVLNARQVFFPLDPARDWEPDVEALEALVTTRTKAIVLNSPGNPTGAVYGREVIAAVLEVARRHDLWLIADECYDEIVFEGEQVSAATLGDADRVITVYTFSKSYAMTGWRVGYVVARPDVAAAIAKAQEPVVGNASSVSQKAAEAALLGPQDCVHTMRDAYRERRDAVVAQLEQAEVDHVRPRGAFYLMVDVSPAGESLPFAKRLLQEQQVSVVPGSAFGPGGEGWVRASLCVDPEVLREGIERLAALVRAGSPAVT